MPITVELQDMHSYSPLMIILVIIFAALSVGVAIFIIVMHFIHKNAAKNVRPVVEISPENRINIKQKYIAALNELEVKYREKKMSNRKAYQELSRIIRHFVYEATGIKVHNYTLQEIKSTNIVGLYEVVSECYAPEFAVDKNGEIFTSIAKARKVIEEWN